MRKVIYQIDIGREVRNKSRWAKEGQCVSKKRRSSELCGLSHAETEYTIPSAKKYAKKIGADFITIREPAEEVAHIKNVYQQSIATKVYLFREFLKTDYEKMLFLDCDVFVKDNAPDIFEYDQHKYNDLLLRRIIDGQNRAHKEAAKDGLNSKAVQFYNTGVFVTGRYSAERIYRSIVELYQGQRPPMPLRRPFDECFLGHLICESETRTYPLDTIWNCAWRVKCRRDGFAFFIHYLGPDGKKALVEDAFPNIHPK